MRTVAVLGAGNIGLRHAAALRAAGARPLVVPVRASRIRDLAEDGWDCARSLEEAAAQGARACVIATDTGRHAADALEALRLGMDVLVEKPLSVDARGALLVAREAARRRRRAFVGCVLRFSRSLELFRRELRKIGPVHAVSAECRSYLPDWRPARSYRRSYSARADEGGVLRDLIHEVDYAGWLFGWPSRVEGRLENLGRLGIAAEELAHLRWTAPGGASVTVALDYLTRPARRRLAAYGAKGTLEWDAAGETVRLWRPGKAAVVLQASQPKDERLLLQARAFLRGRADERLATAAEGARALAVCDAARRSSKTGRAEAAR